MDRDRAHLILAEELERWRRLPFDDLVGYIGSEPYLKTVLIGAEVVDAEVRVRWAGPRPGAVRVEAVANGPSCWRLERLEESPSSCQKTRCRPNGASDVNNARQSGGPTLVMLKPTR